MKRLELWFDVERRCSFSLRIVKKLAEYLGGWLFFANFALLTRCLW